MTHLMMASIRALPLESDILIPMRLTTKRPHFKPANWAQILLSKSMERGGVLEQMLLSRLLQSRTAPPLNTGMAHALHWMKWMSTHQLLLTLTRADRL